MRAERQHIWPARPTIAATVRVALPDAALFAPLWALAMAGLAAGHLWWAEQGLTARTLAIVLLFAAGGLLGSFVAWIAAAVVACLRRHPSARFAAMVLSLGIGTVATTALLFFLQFRAYYAQWHDATLSKAWIVETLMTGATAAYLFGIEGMRILLPWGLPLLLLAALVFTRRQALPTRAGPGIRRPSH
ncbi:hypothetical protein [Polymorphum gilvum]|uniref:Hypothetical transmembrane protein n=1 Tax=Polymorphum gilvum (strain LMG 25793 / CGMCC 1.9160 / SL003B-26A1) TaxID=991905 RepID=F2J4X5_POLGS|nr:hypothetical protein [Polymorphum gilvum]ADZ70017.1 Hypothetical transmembrane protein [Polymorphum gilvum SL003B-26A1]